MSITSSLSLSELRRGESAIVVGLEDSKSPSGSQLASDALLARLRDLGFVAGARCEVIARMWPAGDPVAVRIGGSMFALRRAEASAVRVIRLQERAKPDFSAALA